MQLIRMENASLTRNGHRMVGPVSLSVERGKHLALVGDNGSGKTSLLKLLRGDALPDPGGNRVYGFDGAPQSSVLGLRHRMALVASDMQDFYTLHTARATGRSIILAGFFDTPLLYETATPQQEAAADAVIKRLGIQDIAAAPLGTLSTGQLRKLLIARALVSEPDILLLDECLEGLDAVAQGEVLHLLNLAAETATLICTAHRMGDVPRCVERVMVMEHGIAARTLSRPEAVEFLREVAPPSAPEMPVRSHRPEYDFLVRMRNVAVVADGTRILDAISWHVLPGEQWCVLGANGAGKSTLLRLVTSEISPYADEDHGVGTVERLGGMPMAEARPRIGVVSPALQVSYGRELAWEVRALETVLSGFRGSVGMLDQPTDREMAEARRWLSLAGLAELQDRPLRRMSYGQQRRALLARAMAPGPDLLLLDEPMSGLDPASRSLMLDLLQRLAEAGTPLVMVTHHPEDRIPAINRIMQLENGRIRFCGTRDEFDAAQAMG